MPIKKPASDATIYHKGYLDGVIESSWECGDCGNRYDAHVFECPNKILDDALVNARKYGTDYEA